ncbi:ATP-binding protein [Actinomadura algeriensis]|uniref:Serine/threonine-protein kinase RsbW n=1 Tax=Actinomadura algeriensis TaxID=1679523 RepID=A0ABR9JNF4_9ACTN|nr:ATP-binding protein [Actinomadura algeriensis]MBE1531886.1 serine/threonine-protein kinase RsbW [Actinomadura algeriensis]
MDVTFTLALPREAPTVPLIRRLIGDALRGLGAADDCVDDILVAASEACTNVIRHTRASGDYRVAARVDESVCELEITDRGRGPRPAPADRGVLSETGRGIKIMRALVDDLAIDHVPERGTVVHMRKRLTWRDGALVHRPDARLITSAG